MITIFKYKLEPVRKQVVKIEGYLKTFSAQAQGEDLVLYCAVDSAKKLPTNLPVYIGGTGTDNNFMVADAKTFVNTVMMPNGLVWHVFLGKEKA